MLDIVVQNASLTYEDQTIFVGLNLILKGGLWTCLLGPSGVGKTSLLRFIAGLNAGCATSASGTVFCKDGLSLDGRIAWMAQQDLLLPWYNVLDNITLGEKLRSPIFRKNKHTSDILDKAYKTLELVGLKNKAKSLPQNLSGGQKQRAALARTLMENRPLVLMDEPFGALDAITRLNLQDLACDLLSEKTVLLITHDPLEALRIGHQVYNLQGQPAKLTNAIVPTGNTPRSLTDKYLINLQGQLLNRLRDSEQYTGVDK